MFKCPMLNKDESQSQEVNFNYIHMLHVVNSFILPMALHVSLYLKTYLEMPPSSDVKQDQPVLAGTKIHVVAKKG
jgi:hypothetical protein